jgi:hypothetical protein
MPIYKIVDTETNVERLVEAHSRAAALKHITEDRFVVSVPDTAEAVALVAEGVAVEKAVPPTPRQQQLTITDPNAPVPTSFDPGE